MEENQHLPLADRFITFGGAVFNSGGLFRDLDAAGTAIVPSGPWMWDPAKAYPNKVGGTTGSGYLPTIVGGSMLSNRINR